MKEVFEKIIEKLKEEKMSYFLTIANTGDEKLDYAYEQVGDALDNAIKIVKQGSVSDDVCVWRIVDRPNNLPIYNTSCGKIRLQYVTGVDIYCNGCGKKIKVVE